MYNTFCSEHVFNSNHNIVSLGRNVPQFAKINGTRNDDYSESNVLRITWSLIFELLFPSNQHNFIVKTGETISVMSQEHKQGTSSDISNVIAFKIDIRVISKNHGKEIDVDCGKIAKNDEANKIIKNEGKLSRETKDTVDSILTCV